ncbi:phospho-sugar mutase, partial [Flavobacteriaceae bacterium]|nr:phospho-sugar mutase [Flavobacteriaceae bacterium]
MKIKEIAKHWLKEPFDHDTKNEVENLLNDPKKLEDAFYKDLEFGTGGMRGIMGVGTNRINKYTIGKNTQGLSNYLKKSFSDTPIKAVVAYDCRHNSATLAKIVADVFTANGIACYLFSELRATPELSFAVRHLNAHCGIVLTASHNPPEYNGYKVYWNDGGQLVPPQDAELTTAIDEVGFEDIQFYAQDKLLHWIDTDIDTPYQDTVVAIAKWSNGNRDDF